MKEQYFPHDYYARLDPKIENLLDRYGLAGYGAYWVIVERLHECGGSIEKTKLIRLAGETNADLDLLKSVSEDFGLFITTPQTIISERVIENLNARKEISEARRAAQAASVESRKRRKETVEDELQT